MDRQVNKQRDRYLDGQIEGLIDIQVDKEIGRKMESYRDTNLKSDLERYIG